DFHVTGVQTCALPIWLLLARDLGLTVKWLPFNRESWRIEPADLAPLLSERTRLLALNFSSNMTGSVNDVAALAGLARKAGALVRSGERRVGKARRAER